MLRLNLVSEQLKKEIRLRHLSKVLKRAGMVMFGVLLFIAIIVFTSKIVLKENYEKVVAQTSLISESSQEQNDKIFNINSRLDYMSGVQNNFIPWSNLLVEISNCTNANITFKSIKFDKESAKINFQGRAETRDGLLQLKKELEDSAMFLNVNLPLENLLERENINFEISADLSIEIIRSGSPAR